MKLLPALTTLLFAAGTAFAGPPPAGFKSLFNEKDLTGWRGGSTFDHRKLLELPEDARAAQIAKWTATMTAASDKTGKPHWYVEGDELVNDGFGDYATTEKDYGDFELLVEYKTVAKADSGIYLRGVPQVQIWDSTENDEKAVQLGKPKGSGGLWNNAATAPGRDPLVKADKAFGEWNKFRIIMVGSRVSVWLNDQLVVDHAILENYYDKKLPADQQRPVPAKGPIQLQTHGGEIRWRNIFLREIGVEEGNKILSSKGGAGFKSAFNGKDFSGWAGPVDNYEVVAGAIRCKEKKGGTIYVNEDLKDFQARLEFNVPPGGNNGLAIRYPGEGNTAYVGMTELQVLDNDAPKYAKLDVRQYHGSVYGMVAAQRGYTRPAGEWNFEEVTVKGSTIVVELNGTVILNADLSKVDMSTVMANSAHPGKDRTNGFFGFAGHSDPVSFRDISLKKL
ncbi:DUF1080 domain-containing protein [Verrucomicrobium sp. BvORR106]|uniref:3-keto-disaccharide hydrolase n=1 Tax=Verrucomicrobium sp. BvORR106 TaxID=1403819 RepID=UPI000571BA92|nr:DUF1080 domain-containing protein [Verrucomicrobium sp. BvORR106]